MPMLSSMLVSLASAGTATLHVGIHRDAGTLADLAVDGASGRCSLLNTTRIVCPADGPVTFRWGPADDWVLTGDSVVQPGDTGTAFVLAASGTLSEVLTTLEEPTVENVRAAYFRTGANPVPIPTLPYVQRLVELASHEDWRIRLVVTDSLMPFVRHTSSDPLPPGAPTLLPAGLLTQLATDDEKRVRRRAAHLIRELSREDPHIQERRDAVRTMKKDKDKRVRKLATVLERQVAIEGEDEALEAWNGALSRVPKPGAPGRAACNSLAVLHGQVDTERIDPLSALTRVISFHPERGWRVWSAWRQEIAFDPVSAEYLLRETVGLSQPLLRHWAANAPEELADLLVRWEPVEPHSERWRVISRWVDPKADNGRLRTVLALPDRMSAPPESADPD